MTEKQRKKLFAVLKVVISAALIYFIFTKINLKDVVEVFQTSKPFYLLCALLLFIASKIFNAFRLNLYFHQIDAPLTELSNLKLYLLGMFYNLFLPGGIGGDAYKGYVVQKRFQPGTKKVVAVLLLDRLSGMLLILIYGCILALVLKNEFLFRFRYLFLVGIPLAIVVFWTATKKFFSYTLPRFLEVFWLFGHHSIATIDSGVFHIEIPIHRNAHALLFVHFSGILHCIRAALDHWRHR